MKTEFAEYKYDLEESRNNMLYKTAPSFLSGNILKEKFIRIEMIYDYADMICRELKNIIHPINSLYCIKWIRDFSQLENREVPIEYIRAHNYIIDKHSIDEIYRPDDQCVYLQEDEGYSGFL